MTVDNGTLTRPALTNLDLIDAFVDEPLTVEEAGQVLAYYLPFVAAYSPAGSHGNWFLAARLQCSAMVGKFLDPRAFTEAAILGEEIHSRRAGHDGEPCYADWSMGQLFDDLATAIDQMLAGQE
jgi:hypothetical protein